MAESKKDSLNVNLSKKNTDKTIVDDVSRSNALDEYNRVMNDYFNQEKAKETVKKQSTQAKIDSQIIEKRYEAKPIDLDKDFKKKYVKDEKSNYRWAFKPEIVAFTDKKGTLLTQSKNINVADDMLKLLQSKGVSEVKVSGTKEFKSAVWLAAQDKDMTVQNYKPTKEELKQLADLKNSIAPAKDMTKEIKDKLGSKDRKNMAKKDPQLKALISQEKTVTQFAKSSIHAASQAKFVSAVMETLVNKAAQGEKIPVIKDTQKELTAER